MGFGFDGFPKNKIPGRSNFKGGSVGLSFNTTTEKAILFVDKVKIFEIKIENLNRLGLGLSKISMEAFITADGRLVKSEKEKQLGMYHPVVNLGSGMKVRVYFEEWVL